MVIVRVWTMLVLLLMLLVACDSADEAGNNTPSATVSSSRVQAESPTPRPTRTQFVPPPRPSPTLACVDAPRTRLILGERGQVSDEDEEALNVRSGPGTGFDILGIFETYDIFTVLDGPRCGGAYAWYLVSDGQLRGWIAEGDFDLYYVEPYLPG